MPVKIRPAVPADAAALLAVYEPFIKETAVTFEYTVPSVNEFAQRIEEISSFYPYLVYELDGRICGYAYAHRHHERAAFQWNAELSVYVSPSVTGHGIGSALYGALIELLILQGVQNFYGCMVMPNAASDALHRKMGFKQCCFWHNSGYKLGKWHDVAWYEMNLSVTAPPPTLRSVHEISEGSVKAVLEKYGR